MKPKSICLVPDSMTWCWGRAAIAIQKHQPSWCQTTIIPHATFDKSLAGQFDAVLWFNWAECPLDLPCRTVAVLASHAVRYRLNDRTWPAISCLTKTRNREKAERELPKFSGIISVNAGLHDFAMSIGALSACLPAGVDDIVFHPESTIRHSTSLTVGWCGQCTPGVPNPKGFDWVLIPLIQSLGRKVKWKLNARYHLNALSEPAMVEWYQEIDVLACTSIHEGGPTPVFEAMACGVPCVSTSVGDAADVIDGRNGILCGTYHDAITADSIVAKLSSAVRFFDLDRQALDDFGASARQTIVESRSWRQLAPQWLAFAAGVEA